MIWLSRPVSFCCVLALVVGCVSPSELVFQRMDKLGLDRTIVTGANFSHLMARENKAPNSEVLHVYIDHDGLPWVRPNVVSSDPTPRLALGLELMARDEADRIYLGRPCYFGLMGDPDCNSRQWTDSRYSDAVVGSMAAALNSLVEARGASTSVVLIGYSGGGTLAFLMAPRVPSTTAVITIGANLDVAAWTALHHYSALTGSLDPALEPTLPAGIKQVHMLGGRDTVVPPAISRHVTLRQPGAVIVDIAEFDHVCCWVDRWPTLLHDALVHLSD